MVGVCFESNPWWWEFALRCLVGVIPEGICDGCGGVIAMLCVCIVKVNLNGWEVRVNMIVRCATVAVDGDDDMQMSSRGVQRECCERLVGCVIRVRRDTLTIGRVG